MNNIYDHIRNHRVQPQERTWRLIREKLSKRKAKQKTAFYRNLSIAAGIVAIISFTIGFTGHWNIPGTAVDPDHHYQPIAFEVLPIINDDPFYDYSKILVIDKFPLLDIRENTQN